MNAVTSTETAAVLQALDAPAERHRIADLLPYQFLGEIEGLSMVHLLDDQSFGIGFRIGVPSVESSIGGNRHMADTIDQIIRKLPVGYVAQWYRCNSTDVTELLDLYRQQTGNDFIGEAISNAHIQRWEGAMEKGFFPENPDLNFYPTREEMAVMIKAPPTKGFNFSAEQAFAMLRNLEAPSPRYTRSAKEFKNAIRSIREAALAGSMAITPMKGAEFVPFVISLLWPRGLPRKNMPAYNEVESISEAISAAGEIDIDDGNGRSRTDGFKSIRDGKTTCHRVVSMIWQPKSVEPGMCNHLMYKEPNITVITTVEMVSQLWHSAKVKAQKFISSRNTTSLNATEAAEKEKSLTEVSRRIFKGEKICKVRMQAIISSDTEEKVDNAAARVKSEMDSLMTAVHEDTYGASLILPCSLPFTHSGRREGMIQRQRRMMSMDIAEMMPVGGYWQGVPPTKEYFANSSNRKKPIVMYSNAVGGPLFINPHLCETNSNMLVAGSSGGGKSFFMQDLLLQMWRNPDIRVYMISIKPDYRRLSHVLGKYIEINLDSEMSLNPFGGKPTLENQAIWEVALVLMITDGDPNERVSKDDRIILQKASMRSAEKNWNYEKERPFRETLLQDIADELTSYFGTDGARLARRLSPYYQGPYKNLINAPRSLKKNDKFAFFNLANVQKLPCCAVMMFCLFRFIDEIMYDGNLVGTPKVAVFDEGWAGMDDPSSAALFTKSFRAYRSLGGQAIAISQRFADYDTPLGQAILSNTATKIILPQAESDIRALGNYMVLNDLEKEAVRKLKLQKRYYGEFFVKMQGMASTTGRVIPNPLSYAIATSDAYDESLHQQLLEEFKGDHLAAIAEFANRYPYGNEVRH